ncbi:Uncharacterized protein TCAP_03048, partial [Tolypocladium capitatum]
MLREPRIFTDGCPFCGGITKELEREFPNQHGGDADEAIERHVRDHLIELALVLAPIEIGERDVELKDPKSNAQRGANSVIMSERSVTTPSLVSDRKTCDRQAGCKDEYMGECEVEAKDPSLKCPTSGSSTQEVTTVHTPISPECLYLLYDDPSYRPDADQKLEWEFCYLYSLSPDFRRIGPPEYPTHAEDKKLLQYFGIGAHQGDQTVKVSTTQDRHAILDWLTTIDYTPQQTHFFNQRYPGTCQWFLDTPEFQGWLSEGGRTLFCPGMPGAGKTILTSTVVDYLQTQFRDDKSVGIAYIYCSFGRQYEETTNVLLATLLKQLTQGQPLVPDSVKSLHDKHKDKRSRPSSRELTNTLHSVAALYAKVFVLIDAIDECRISDGSRTRFFGGIFSLQDETRASIFATSRYPSDITELFGSISLREIRAAQEDLRRHIHERMSTLPSFIRRNTALQEEVKIGIANSAQGSFLLVHLHIASLMDTRTVEGVRKGLAHLAKPTSISGTYEHAYEMAMERIDMQIPYYRTLARQLFSWIIHAKRPLTTLELQHALAVKVGETELDIGNLPVLEDMMAVCSGRLVTVDEQSDTVRFIHYTAQQYFDKNREKLFPDAECDITAVCVTYLSFNVFESGFCRTDEEFEERLRLYPFYAYAAQNWGHHAREAPALHKVAIDFLHDDRKVESSSQALMAIKGPQNYSQDVPRYMTGLHLVAYFGIRDTAQTLIDRNSLEELDSHCKTPLFYAAEHGHEDIVELLHEMGADVNLQDAKDSRTPLSWAAENGHEAIVKLLLDTG